MVKKGQAEGVPVELHGHPEATVIFNNLMDVMWGDVLKEEGPMEIQERVKLALKIDETMRKKAPAGWKRDSNLAGGPR